MEQIKKVRCIDNKDVENSITIGKEYLVFDIKKIDQFGNYFYNITNDKGNSVYLHDSFFEFVLPNHPSITSSNVSTTLDIKPEQDKKVKCINNRGAEYILVIGQEYKVIREQELYYIIDHENYGELQLYKKFFEVEIEDKIKPQHYEQPITPIEFIMKNNIPFIEGNVIKYICRYKQKNGKEDLLKAKQYIDFLLEQYETQI